MAQEPSIVVAAARWSQDGVLEVRKWWQEEEEKSSRRRKGDGGETRARKYLLE